MEKTMSVKEIAMFLGYHEKHIYMLLKNGTIPNKKILGRIIVLKKDFDEWINYFGERNGN